MNEAYAMYYITDFSGNYYRVNPENQLVAAGSRAEAGVFSTLEAAKRLQGGKKTHFYQLEPIEEVKIVTQTIHIQQAVADGRCKLQCSAGIYGV